MPPAARMRRSAEFALAVRTGARAGRPAVVGHLLVRADRAAAARVGFVVSRAVGPAVTRNRVKRRLRALVLGYLQLLPGGSLLVVRANAAAAHASQPDLAADLDSVISRLLRRQVGAHVGNATDKHAGPRSPHRDGAGPAARCCPSRVTGGSLARCWDRGAGSRPRAASTPSTRWPSTARRAGCGSRPSASPDAIRFIPAVTTRCRPQSPRGADWWPFSTH